MIDICADIELKDTLVVDVPKIESDGYILHTIHVEYEWKPSRCPTCKLFDHSLDQCPKKTVYDLNVMNPKKLDTNVLKNVKSQRQTVCGIHIGSKSHMV